MNKKQLIKKAHYFGANIGCEFVYNERTLMRLIGVFLVIEQNRLILNFDTEVGIIDTLELPEDEEGINKLKVREYEKVQNFKRKIRMVWECTRKKMRKTRKQNYKRNARSRFNTKKNA